MNWSAILICCCSIILAISEIWSLSRKHWLRDDCWVANRFNGLVIIFVNQFKTSEGRHRVLHINHRARWGCCSWWRKKRSVTPNIDRTIGSVVGIGFVQNGSVSQLHYDFIGNARVRNIQDTVFRRSNEKANRLWVSRREDRYTIQRLNVLDGIMVIIRTNPSHSLILNPIIGNGFEFAWYKNRPSLSVWIRHNSILFCLLWPEFRLKRQFLISSGYEVRNVLFFLYPMFLLRQQYR